MRNLYLLMAALGLIVPFYFFSKFLIEFGMDMQLFVELVFANPISTFFAVDLIIATLVFYIFLYREAHRVGVNYWWIYIIFSLFIGLSFALPIFLYSRERKMMSENHL